MSNDAPTNEVLSVKLDYIQKDLVVIKSDVKEMKADYVTRREFDTNLKDTLDTTKTRFAINEKNIETIFSYVKWIVGLIIAGVVAAILKLVIK